jgi:Sugar-binding N-terminal domain
MTAPHLGTPQPPFTRAVSMQALLADQPPVRDVGTNLDEIRVGRRLVVLDDDPTGTQCVADLPVLTRWSVRDLQWAFQQPTTGFFVLTNTRSLSEADAAERNREIVQALAAAAQQLFLIAEAAGLGAHDDSSVVTVLCPDTQERTTT